MQNRINKIKEYFKGFNITDGIAYVHVSFQKGWQIPDSNILKSEFNTNVASDDTGVYFFTQYENGINLLFDAADFVIEFNKDLEEKTELFKAKVDELRELFTTSTLDELKTLVISIPKVAKSKNRGSKRKNAKNEVEKEVNVSEVDEVKVEVHDNSVEITNSQNDNSMLDFVMGEINNDNLN